MSDVKRAETILAVATVSEDECGKAPNFITPVRSLAAVQRLLWYSWRDIGFEWEGLTSQEKRCISREEHATLLPWVLTADFSWPSKNDNDDNRRVDMEMLALHIGDAASECDSARRGTPFAMDGVVEQLKMALATAEALSKKTEPAYDASSVALPGDDRHSFSFYMADYPAAKEQLTASYGLYEVTEHAAEPGEVCGSETDAYVTVHGSHKAVDLFAKWLMCESKLLE